ncbi:Peptidoglycan-N-acetylmuramic acid deacetylase PdaA precursor [Sporomusa ovata DSM 2662]|uniref:Peptidoglycan N-acetylglucosamine deacetylase n=1 Tax=Sporomusa ovata TaxID=2378 RepID=A0A0U1L6Y2_9FIRM|nr:polysaccharide deacetylase family protein [Sporomusa ovata]EQB28563.1 polysaccharide deacetylase [Sporomusa ovata DSM 2662]CQR74893.1 Peptidoglycan N-acetylglucosamine deacetylase [Sporomusa ovata]
MKGRTLVLVLILITGVSLATVFFYKDYQKNQPVREYSSNITIDDLYNADKEVAQALAQLEKSQEKATIVTGVPGSSRQIALTFDGLTDRNTMQQILVLLKKYNSKATFFVDGLHTVEDPQTLADIKNAGQKIENFTLLGMPKMENLPIERLAKDFCRAEKIVKENATQEPNLLKCNDTKYTDQVLQVAKACGFKSVVQSDAFFNVRQSNAAATDADAFVAALRPGSIVSVKLLADIELITNEPGKTDLKPAIDKQPGLKEMSQEGLREPEIALAVEKLLQALQKAQYSTVYVEDYTKISSKTALWPDYSNYFAWVTKTASFLQEQIMALFSCPIAYAAEGSGQPATEIKTIFTTEQALSYTFGGLSKESVVNDVLERLNRLGIKATFFVSEAEMKKYPQIVRKIIANKHEVGIAIRPKAGASVEETRKSIMSSSRLLKEQFGVYTNLVKQVSGAVSDTTREAVGSLEYKLIGQSINIVQTKQKDYTSVDAIMAELFRKSMLSLARGQILYFRMDFYTDDQIVGNLLESIKQNKIDNIAYATFYDNPGNNRANNSQYMIKPVGEILNNTKYTYQYPVDLQKVPPHLRHDGPEIAIDSHNFLVTASQHYIGQNSVNLEDRMIGFSKMDERRLDQTGFVHTKDNVIFLTFDDWGSDAAINKLLYVLRKHNVPGTFFIITNNVLYNPNLLRAIAVEGHEIGSHSDKHKPMAVMDPKTHKYVKTQEKEEYLKDLTTSYQKLREVTGDVTVNGKPALTRYFRAPTLAISKMGIEALLDAGYDYIISGSTSTNDYKAKDITQLVDTIKEGVYTQYGEVKKGAILVMHMGDSVIYTPAALDILLTANEAKADSDPSKFKVGRLSDYLFDGYSQINPKKTLRLLHSADNVRK